jgi:pimeloyl-ACP methyl ester carboxylesterase
VLLYLHGFASGPQSTKARALKAKLAAIGRELVVPELTPGEGGFERSTPSSMLAVASALLDGSPDREHRLMGSSLGGYLAAILAERRRDVSRLVLLAPAFRMAERWRARIGEEGARAWKEEGLLQEHYATGTQKRIGYAFLEDADRLPAWPRVNVPALCLCGVQDELVPIADVATWVARTPGAKLVPLDDGHELSLSIERIWTEAKGFLGF